MVKARPGNQDEKRTAVPRIFTPRVQRLQQPRLKRVLRTTMEPPVRVRSREGEEVDCSRMAARSAGTLRHMIDDTAEGICPVDVPVVVLRVVLDACNHDDSGFSRMASHSLEELVAVMTGANYLDSPGPGAFSSTTCTRTVREQYDSYTPHIGVQPIFRCHVPHNQYLK